MKSMLKLFNMYVRGLALVTFVSACGSSSDSSILQESSDPVTTPAVKLPDYNLVDSSLLEIQYFDVSERSNQNLAGLEDVFPVIIVKQPIKAVSGPDTYVTYGFAVDCKAGRDTAEVIKAFGLKGFNSGQQAVEPITEQVLINAYHIDEQPILRCDALKGAIRGANLFDSVFRVDVAGKVRFIARFNSTDPKISMKLYEVGCRNILDNFIVSDAPEYKRTALILQRTLAELPGISEIGILPCSASDAQPHIQSSEYYWFGNGAKTSASDVRLYTAPNNGNGTLRVLITNKQAFNIECTTSSDSDLQKAFNLPVTGTLKNLATTDADYQFIAKIKEQPTLFCPSPTRPNFATDAYFVENSFPRDLDYARKSPLLRLAKALGKTNGPDTLLEFGCEKAAALFEPKLLAKIKDDPNVLENVVVDSLDYIVREKNPGKLRTKRYFIGCHTDVSLDRIKQLYRDVYAKDIVGNASGPSPLWDLQKECMNNECSESTLASRWSDSIKKDDNEMKRIIFAAFQGEGEAFPSGLPKGRAPFPEELQYILDRVRAGQNLNPQYAELKKFLSTARFLDRDALAQSLMNHYGSEWALGITKNWTTKQFNESGRTFSLNDFAQFNEDNTPGWESWVASRAYLDRGLDDPSRGQSEKLAKVRNDSKTVGSLYKDFVKLLTNAAEECVNVDAKKPEESFQFLRKHINVQQPIGQWSNINEWFGPEGRKENNQTVGQLQFWGTNAWIDWWSDGKFPAPGKSLVKMRMNDSYFEDNKGSLKVCLR